MYTHDTRACTKMELLITVEFEANVCLNDVPWTTTKMKPSFRTNRRANIGGLYLESWEFFIQISIANTYNYYVVDVPLLMALPWPGAFFFALFCLCLGTQSSRSTTVARKRRKLSLTNTSPPTATSWSFPMMCLTFTLFLLPASLDSNHSTAISFAFRGS